MVWGARCRNQGRRAGAIARLMLATLASLIGAASVAAAEEPPQPILQVDTGGHNDRVRGLAYARDGSRLYSAGFDKAIRVWDLASGTTQKVLRGQIDGNDEGNIYALALSPDETVLAVGGYMSADCPTPACGDIRLFDPRLGSSDPEDQSGRVTGRLSGHTNVVLALAYAPDGRRLASAGADRTVRVWDMATRKEVARFDTNKDGRSEKLAWTADGQFIVVGSAIKSVQIFSLQGSSPVAVLQADETLHAVATSADGRYVAAASASGAIHVWNWPRGDLHRRIPGNGASISVLTFGRGPSAHLVVSGPSTATADGRYASRIADVSTGAVSELAVHNNVVTAITVSADGREIATAGGTANEIMCWSPLKPAPGRALKGSAQTVYSVGFLRETTGGGTGSREVTHLAWGFDDPCPGVPSCPDRLGPLQYALPIPTPAGGGLGKVAPLPLKGAAVAVRQARITHEGARLVRLRTDATSRRYPTLSIEDGAKSSSSSVKRDDQLAYTFDAKGSSVAAGGRNGTLDIYDRALALRRTLPSHSGDIFSVSYDETGRLLATGGGDNTVRLWNPDTGKLVVSLLHTVDGEWVIWTPQGYFDASPGGERLVGWQINRGPDRSAEHVTGDQVRSILYKPDVVERAIALASAETAVDDAVRSGQITDFKLADLRERLPPRFEIVDPPAHGPRAKAKSRDISVAVAWPRDRQKAERYDILVNNDRLRAEDFTTRPDTFGELQGLRFDNIRLSPGRNTIKIVATADGVSHTETIEVDVDEALRGEERETIYVVAIGVDHYDHLTGCRDAPDGKCNLEFASRDATEFVRTIGARMVGAGKGHVRLEPRILHTGAGPGREPTKENIVAALDMLAKAGPRDTAMLFVAGHGVNDAGYKFLPSDARRQSNKWDPRTVLPWRELQGALEKAGGRRLLFVDTCRSVRGEDTRVKTIVNDGLARDISVFTSTDGEQDAEEVRELKHGVFTYAVIKAMEGEGDIAPRDRNINLYELGTYVNGAVSAATGQRQEPHFDVPKSVKNYVLVRLP